MKYLFLTILSLFIFIPTVVQGATEFISTIQQTGGDYSTLASWEGAVQSDLTATTTRVFTGTGTGQLSNGDTVTCVSGGTHDGITARVVATTTTQILLDNATSSEDIVLTDGDTWENGSNVWTVSGSGDELGDTAIAIAKIDGAWTSADTAALSITGWDTSATNYIRIYTTGAARHQGKWTTTAYIADLPNAGYGVAFYAHESYLKIDGLQLTTDQTYLYHTDTGESVTGLEISNCIFDGQNKASNFGIYIGSYVDSLTLKVWNSIFYDFSDTCIREYYVTNSTIEVYNTVVYNCTSYGMQGDNTVWHIINSVAFDTGNDFYDVSTGASTMSNCASDDGDGTNPVTPSNWSSVFEDYANGDFHLKSTDTDLKNAGTNLYSEGITDDIDGDTRPASNWDIGADEEMSAVEFVSTIMEDTVGDYHSLSEWEGAVDCDLTASSTRVYSFDAPSGWVSDGASVSTDSGASTATLIHAASSSQALLIDIQGSFDDNDLVTDGSNNFTLSNNGAPAIATAKIDGAWTNPDQTAVVINTWTTATSTYIRIYTTETARHNGKWNTGKYRIEADDTVLLLMEENVRIEGLQINVSPNNSDSSRRGIYLHSSVFPNDVRISHNIIKQTNTGTSNYGIGLTPQSSSGKNCFRVWNNIIYDFSGTTSYGIGLTMAAGTYIYNNTVFNCTNGIYRSNGTIYAKNNISYNNTDNYVGTLSGDYNFSGPADDAQMPGANSRYGPVLFVDEDNDDFHLAGSDTAARDAGVDLSGDSNLAFTDDIDGEGRGAGGAWDIGADEKKRSTVINAPLTNKLTDGLVGHWTFNGQDMDWASTTAEALDRSGNSNNGNVVNFGLEGATDGISGQALEFDGSVDVVNCGTDDSLNNISTLTVTAWVYPTGWGGSDWGRIISKGDASAKTLFVRGSGSNTEALSFWHDFSSNNGMWNTGDYTLSLNQWQHVAVTFDNSSDQHVPKIYIDGVGQTTYEIDAPSGTAVLDGSYDLLIGNNANDDRAFVGVIDEVRIYNRALATSTIQDLYQAGARRLTANAPMTQKQTGGLVGNWTFNGQDMDWGNTTAEARDRSGQGRHGDVVGAKATDGKVGQALEFDGVDDRVGISGDIIGTATATVCAWINPVVSDDSFLGNVDFQMIVAGSGVIRVTNNNRTGPNADSATGVWTAGTWVHACMVRKSNGDTTIYGDGSVSGTPDQSTTVSDPTGWSFRIGTRGSAGAYYFDGLIDEVRIYNRALATSTIQDLYQAGARRFKLK